MLLACFCFELYRACVLMYVYICACVLHVWWPLCLCVSLYMCVCFECDNMCVPLCLSRDLMAWLNSMAALMSSDELAKDVSSAEALLEAQQVQHTSVCGISLWVYV